MKIQVIDQNGAKRPEIEFPTEETQPEEIEEPK